MSSRFTDASAFPGLSLTPASDLKERRDRLEEEVVALFDQYRDPLLRYVSSFGIAFPDGEDVIQEIFLSLFRHLHRGKSHDNLRGWLFRVAHNLALKRHYRTRRESEVLNEGGAENLAIDVAPSPEDRVANSQMQEQLLTVVRALSEQDRRCLLLRAEGLRYREIAAVLNMSLGAVSCSLARSLARIARHAERYNL